MLSNRPTAIIDIGSNSVRLVVYAGEQRVPRRIFNEKVLAGLGKDVGVTGNISAESWDCAIAMLKRFKLLLGHMGARRHRVLATAAVRDAANGREFEAAVGKIGFKCEVISPEEEARLAGEGVLSGFPGARGIAGDLGGGSLEFVQLRDGVAGPGISLPLGVLRLTADGPGEKRASSQLRQALNGSGLARLGKGLPFYMVGGSWRALARIDMLATDYPLPVTHGYEIPPSRVAELRRMAEAPDPRWTKGIAAARLASTSVAAMLLTHIVELLKPSSLVVSGFGIREGLLYSALDRRTRGHDPLIEAAREAGEADRRFGEHGDVLDAWLAPLFDDSNDEARIRRAACLLADVAWQADAEFRAERGIEMALHGNWIGITADERVMMAQALASNFGREKALPENVARLCSADRLQRAHRWGLAMRLGQRLSGGVASVFERTGLSINKARVALHIPRRESDLFADPVARRLQRLASALGREPALVTV